MHPSVALYGPLVVNPNTDKFVQLVFDISLSPLGIITRDSKIKNRVLSKELKLRNKKNKQKYFVIYKHL